MPLFSPSADWPVDFKDRVYGNFRTEKSQRPTPAQRAKAKRAARKDNSDDHLARLRALWCTLGHDRPVDVHHLQGPPTHRYRGLGLRSPDRFAVPLVHWRHMELHSLGSRHEVAYFAQFGMDPYALAEALWANSFLGVGVMGRVLVAHQLHASKVIAGRR